jgi:hypothetical protein
MKKEHIKESLKLLLVTVVILGITGSFSTRFNYDGILIKGILVFLIVGIVYEAGEKHETD